MLKPESAEGLRNEWEGIQIASKHMKKRGSALLYHQGAVNQNHSEILPHRDSCSKKDSANCWWGYGETGPSCIVIRLLSGAAARKQFVNVFKS